MKDTQSSEETTTDSEASPTKTGLSETGIRAMQGPAPEQTSPKVSEKLTIVGTPHQDTQYWHKQEGQTCAIAAQKGIIEKHTGYAFKEKDLFDLSKQNEWSAENGGTPWATVGKLLEEKNVPIGFRGEGDMKKLESELAQRHDVLAAVDPGHLWKEPGYIGKGHIVWVTGLEKNEKGNVTNVFLNDTGNPAIGAAGKISVETFEDAWFEHNNKMVSTKDAAPPAPSVGEKENEQN